MATTRRTFLKGIAAVGALTFAPVRGFGQLDPIQIGHQAPLTGFLAGFGFWHNRAIEAQIGRINAAGGINGRSLELVTVDTQSSGNIGATELEEGLLGGPNCIDPVDFVIGSVLSETNIFSAPLARDCRTPYFGQGVATPITGVLGNRWIFKSYHTAQGAVEAGWRWALENLGTRWTIIHSELAFAQAQADAWAAKLDEVNATLVDTIAVPFDPASPPNFTQFLNLIDTNSTDAIFQAFTARDTIAFMQQAADLGLTSSTGVLGLIEGIDLLDVDSAAFENTHYITSYPRRASQVPASLQTFDQTYRQAVGIDDEGRALSDSSQIVPIADLFGSWQALSLIKQICEQISWSSRADHPAFIQALEGFLYDASNDFPQGSGFVRADDHQTFHGHYIEQVVNGSMNVVETTVQDQSFYLPTVDYRGEAL